jgi:hypothetical protein
MEVTRRLGVRGHEGEGRGDACCERDFAGLCAGLFLQKDGWRVKGCDWGWVIAERPASTCFWLTVTGWRKEMPIDFLSRVKTEAMRPSIQ